MTRVCVLLPAEPGDGSWIDAAVEAASGLDAGVEVDVVVGVPDVLPAADVVLAHGIQYESLVRRPPSGRQRVIMSDRPEDLAGLGHVTVVDWAWAEAARVAGVVGAVAAAGGRVGLVAGPAVRTQRLLAEAFRAGVERAGVETAHVEHLPSFDDVHAGRRAGRRLADLGCRAMLATADAAGDAAAAVARSRGVETFGFLHAHPEDVGHVRSDVAGVLGSLLARAVVGADLEPVVSAGLASGHLALELRADAPRGLVLARDLASFEAVGSVQA